MSKAFYFILALAIAGGSLAITNPFDLPIVFAQVSEEKTVFEQGQDYTTYQFVNGTFQYVSHFPYFETETGNFMPYRLIEDSDIIQIEIDGGKYVFDKNTGGLTTFVNGTETIQSDSYIVRSAELDTDNWFDLDVNQSPVTVFVSEQNFEDIIITVRKQNDEGIFDVDFFINGMNVKATAKFTNSIYPNHKFAFTETLNLVNPIISLNDQEIDIRNYVGQTFPRQVLEENMDLILDLQGLYYSSGLGFDNLWSVGIFENNKISLDYANVGQTQTAIGETSELDPDYYAYRNTKWCWSTQTWQNNAGCEGNDLLVGYTYEMSSWNLWSTTVPKYSGITSAKLYQKIGHSSSSATVYFNALPYNTSADVCKNSSYSISSARSYSNAVSITAPQSMTTVTINLNTSNVSDRINDDQGVCIIAYRALYQNSYAYGGNNSYLVITYTAPPQPNEPTSLSITQDTAGELDLSWTAPSSGTPPTGYRIDRSIDNSNWTTLTSNTGSTATTYTDTSLSANTLYYYRVYSYNSGSSPTTSTNYTSNSQTTWDYPEQVTGLSATNGDPISLSWSAPASDDTIINYKVYRDTVFLKTVAGTSTTDSPPSYGTSYSYTVSAVSAVGEGSQSTSVNGLRGTPPNPPTSVSTSITNPNTNPLNVLVSYSSPTNVGSGTLTGFEIVRDGSVVATVGLVTSYTDTVPSAGTYTYLVRAISTHGTSSDSNTSNITTPTTADPPTLSLAINNPNPNPFDITVSITPPANNGGSAVTGYNIYSSPDDTTYTLESSNVTTAQTITVSGKGTWYFKAESINPIGTGSLSTAFSIATPTEPSAINNLSATANSDSAIALSWSSPNNGGSSITLYKIFQDAVQIDTTTNTSYTVTGLSPNTSYDFTVVASNNVGDSTASNTATQTTYLEITGHIDLTATTQGSTTQFIFSANVTAGTPTPTFSTFDILKNGVTIASNISSPYNLKLTDTASNTYTIISTDNTHWNTPSINGTATATASYQADWQTDLLGTNEIAYNLSRANNQLNLVVNRDTGTNTWHLNCNYRTSTQILAGNNGTWYEVNSWYYDDTQNINDASIVYIDCYNDDVILQITSYSSDRTGGGIAVLNGFFEDWTGTPVALFFVLLVAGLFSGRTAPTGILLILAIVGVMAFVGLLVIDEAIWAFVLLVGILGLFVGKRFL